MKQIKLARMNLAQVADEIEDFIIREIVQEGKDGGGIGLSGGVDSTTAAAISKVAFDNYNNLSFDERARVYGAVNPEKDLKLVGYIIPSSTNSSESTEIGKNLAQRLGIRTEFIGIEPLVQAYGLIDNETINSKFNKGNLMSELRALVLHRRTALENKILIGTGNKDEDFGVGYYTLFGDGAVRISPIGNLPKRLVKEMARYQGFADLADRIPTAELEPGQTDFGDLGYSYDTVEIVSRGIEQGLSMLEIVEDDLTIGSTRKDIKDYENLYGKSKFSDTEDIVKDIIWRNKVAIGKARIVNPPKANVTLVYE